MLMNYSVKIWLSFSKLILMDLLIFRRVQPPFILLKNTWRLFIRLHWTLMEYHPFGIEFWWITKEGSMSLTKYGNLQEKHQLFLFQSSRQCFISVLRNIDFLNWHWSYYSNFTFKLNLLHKITKYFLGINQHFLSSVFIVEKNHSYRNTCKPFINGTNGYMSSSENAAISLSPCQWTNFSFQETTSPFHLQRKLFWIKTCVWRSYL